VAIGELLRLKGLAKRSLKYLEKAIELDKMQVSGVKGLVNACYELGDTQLAKHYSCLLNLQSDPISYEEDLV